MKIHQIKGGYAIAVSNDEDEIIKRIKKYGETKRNVFSEFEQELIETLIRKGVINKKKKDTNDIVLYYNGLEDIWRD